MLRLLELARRAVAFATCALLAASALHADIAFTPLSFDARAISADGTTIVGKIINPSVSEQEAVRWTAASGIVRLGDLPDGPFDSAASAVSADGSVVVGRGTTPGRPMPTGGSSALTYEAFRWTATSGLDSLGLLPGSTSSSFSTGVSSDGSLIVGSAVNASNWPEAFRWTSATGLVSLGFLPGGNSSSALGVSGDGSVIVGNANGADGIAVAFRHTSAGGMQSLGTLIPNDQSRANAASADGSVIVGYGAVANFGREAFRWTAATGLVSLGDLPGGRVRSEALAVSSDGTTIVGSAEGATLSDGAFIWDATNGMRSIRAILTAAGLANGWSISAATGISADGTKIVGYGTNKSGGSQSFLLDFDAPPPPPATVALVWTESGPQPGPGLPGPSILRLGYDNGTIGPDIATQNGASGGGFNGVEYANGLILVANQGSGGTRTHDPRYSPIIVSNVFAYDLDATPSFLWQATGSGNSIIRSNTSSTLTGTGVHDRSYSSASNQLNLIRSTGFFTNALQTVNGSVYFSSTTTSPVGLHLLNFTDGSVNPVHTTGSPAIYDFEVVGDQIYFGNVSNNTIQRVKTDGTGLVTLVTGASFPNGIDVTDTHLYWSELNSGLIRRANLDGSNPVTLIEGRTGLRGLAVLPLSLTTGPAPQALSISGLANIPPFRFTGAINTPIALTPASTSGLPVSLEIVSGPATISGNSITYTGTGTVVVRATQAGDASFAPTTFTTSISAIPRLGQTITFPQPANVTYAGTPVVVTPAATASSGLLPHYLVLSGPATYSSTTRTVTVTGTGTITLRATQTGDTTYAPATFVERTFTASEPGAASPLETYLTTAGVPANQRGPLDDPDGDDIPNLLEFALGLDPVSANANHADKPFSVVIDGNLTLTYVRAHPESVTYVVETTTDLTEPNSWTALGVNQGTPGPDDLTTASIALDGPSRFLRLRVTLVAP